MPPQLQLTQQQLTAALQGLSESERAELLALLEQQERAEDERVVDDRPPLWREFLHIRFDFSESKAVDAEFDEYARAHGVDSAQLQDGRAAMRLVRDFLRDGYATAADDPEKFKREFDAYEDAYERHRRALEEEAFAKIDAEQPGLAKTDRLFAVYEQLGVLWDEAERRAIADGCPRPKLSSAKPAEAPPRDQLAAIRQAAVRRASLPRATLADIEESRVTHAESATFEFIRAEQQRAAAEPIVVDKLAAFRDQTPSGMPPSWLDS